MFTVAALLDGLACQRPIASLDSLVALQAAEWKLRLGITVLVRVWARRACALLPWRRIAGEMKTSKRC